MNYTEWTELLAHHFFAGSRSGRPITFFVDEDTLEEMAGHGAVDDLVAAVGMYAPNPDRGDNPYASILSVCRSWDRREDETAFPGLPLLAVAVLAATRMAKSGDVSAANYYVRFRELMGANGTGTAPGYPETFPNLWRLYSKWLNQRLAGSHGRSTAKEHPRFTNIGYALSQALFRESDRQRLTEFFRWLDVDEEEELDGEELFTYFGVWVRRFERVSAGCRQMLEDPVYRNDLIETLGEEFGRWEGQEFDERGRQLAHLVPALQLGLKLSLRLMAECPDGFPSSYVVASGETRQVTLESSGDGWYRPSLPLSSETLAEGLDFATDRFKLVFEPEQVLPFRQDPSLGMWTMVTRIHPDEPHVALVAHDLVPNVRGFLAEHADEEVRERGAPNADGWTIFGPFAITHAILQLAPVGLGRLVPSVKDRPTLRGGLPLDHGVYLVGGEPDVWLAPSDEPRKFQVGSYSELVSEAGGKIELRKFGLPAGTHEVIVGPTTLRIQTVNSVGTTRPSGTGSLSWWIRADAGHAPLITGPSNASDDERPGIQVIGPAVFGEPGDLPATTPPPIILRGGRKYVVLGTRPGDVVSPETPKTPRWMGHLNLLPYGFEHTPPFKSVFVLTYQVNAWKVRQTHNAPEPDRQVDVGTSKEDIDLWCDALLNSEVIVPADCHDLWGRYRLLAEEVSEE